MEVKVNRLPKSKVEILGDIEWPEFEKYFNQAVDKLGKTLEIKGFRKGQAPKNIVTQELGDDKILAEAAQLAIQENYVQTLDKEKLEPISQPSAEVLKLAKSNTFSFKVHLETMPSIDLPDYKEIAKEVKQEPVKIEDKEVGDALNWLQKTRAEFKPLERGAKDGDFISLKYNSPQIESNRRFDDKFILGEGRLIKGFEESVIGMKQGQEKEFKAEFPKDYFNKDLAGKEAEFQVKVEKVEEMIKQDLNDDFAKAVGKFNSLEELKTSIKQGITQEKTTMAKSKVREEILSKVAEKVKFDLPDTLLWAEEERMLKQATGGRDSELSEDEKKEMKKTAGEQVKKFLTLRAIGRKENITVSDQEAEDATNQFLANKPPVPEGAEQPDPARLKEYYRSMIYTEKTMQALIK